MSIVKTDSPNITMPKPKVLALVSGGLDSVTMLYYLVDIALREPRILYFDYGQDHIRELHEVWYHAEALGLKGERIKLGNLLEGSGLTGGPKSNGYYVPNRNMIFLALAIKCAEEHKIDTIYVGSQKHENQIWDTTSEFVMRMNNVLELNDKNGVRIIAPFAEKSKAEILTIGMALGVDYSHTWSCYEGGVKACGQCSVCKDRLYAFQQLGLKDPLPYR